MPDVGAFTYGVARRSQKGGPEYSDGEGYLTDTYTVVLPSGMHPDEFPGGVTGVPERGDEWDIASGWHADKITWNNEFPNEWWTVDVRYRADDVDQGAIQPPEEPASAGLKWQHIAYQSNPWTFDLEYDIADGRPVKNAAEDRFQQALVTQAYTTTIVIDSNERPSPAEKIAKFQGTLNSKDTTVGDVEIKRHCGLLTINAKEGDDPVRPWAVTYTIQVTTNPAPTGEHSYWVVGGSAVPVADEDCGFDAVVLNTGYRYLRDEEGAVKRFRFVDVDEGGTSAWPVDPQMLDELGEPVSGIRTGERYWYRFQRYREAPWEGVANADPDSSGRFLPVTWSGNNSGNN